MILFIFKYALPALLGYTLFVGIAGRFSPFHKPTNAEERPSWMLGLWVGLSVFLVLSVSLHMAYGMPVEATKSLATATFICLVALLGLGFVGYILYRWKILSKGNALDEYKETPEAASSDWHENAEYHNSEIDISAPAVKTFQEPQNNDSLQSQLDEETDKRHKTEQHLRITRKALSTMNEMSNNTEEENEPPIPVSRDSYTMLDHDLSVDTFAQPGNQQLEELETSVANLKRELIKAKHETRLHIAARAKALSTANKSVAFARQSIELRGRLEAELDTAHIALSNRQRTIKSLIGKLERERRLTTEELETLAPILALNDPVKYDHIDKQAPTDREDQQKARFTNGR